MVKDALVACSPSRSVAVTVRFLVEREAGAVPLIWQPLIETLAGSAPVCVQVTGALPKPGFEPPPGATLKLTGLPALSVCVAGSAFPPA